MAKEEAKEPASRSDTDGTEPKHQDKVQAETPAAESKDSTEQRKRSEWGIWIGNLSFSTTKDDILEFLRPCGGTITRINLPNKNGRNRGFAYVDFDSEAPMNLAIAHSEQPLCSRAVLIKNASDFNKTGRPTRTVSVAKGKDGAAAIDAATSAGGSRDRSKRSAKSEPSPTLFIGNLSFDTKKSDLKKIFKEFGELVGVRVATFEDNPQKCKGFAYIDFKYIDDAKKAIASSDIKSIGGRRTRIEYAGEVATRKGRPWEHDAAQRETQNKGKRPRAPKSYDGDYKNAEEHEDGGKKHKARKLNTDNMAETKLMGVSVQFEGSKVTFGE